MSRLRRTLAAILASRPRKIVAAGVAAATFSVAVAAWLYPDPLRDEQVEMTSVSIFDPQSGRGDNQPKPSATATCAHTSLSSPRRQAHLCIYGGYLLFDPCFEVSDDVVSCVYFNSREFSDVLDTQLFRVEQFIEFYFDERNLARQVGADTAVETSRPYMIELVVDEDGKREGCTLQRGDRPERLEVNDAAAYWCGPNLPAVSNPEGFVKGTDLSGWIYQPLQGGRAVALTRGVQVWRVRYAPFGGSAFTDVQVARAWF